MTEWQDILGEYRHKAENGLRLAKSRTGRDKAKAKLELITELEVVVQTIPKTDPTEDLIKWIKEFAIDLPDDCRPQAKLLEAASKIEKLSALLKECSDDLAVMVESQYNGLLGYPVMQQKYDRDMEPVRKARALLEGGEDAGDS